MHKIIDENQCNENVPVCVCTYIWKSIRITIFTLYLQKLFFRYGNRNLERYNWIRGALYGE